MSDGNSVELEVLIQIREELAGLHVTRKELQGAKKDANDFGQILRQGFGIGSGIELTRRSIDLLRNTLRASVGDAFRLAEEIRDQSEALDLTGEQYQVFKRELAAAGVEAARLSMAINEQRQSLLGARDGVSAMAEAYKDLGLQSDVIEQMDPAERLITVARATLQATDQTEAFGAASQILGSRGLPQLLNALKNLANDGYANVAKAAKDSGQILSDQSAKRLDEAKKNIEKLQNALTVGTGETIGGLSAMGTSAKKDFWGTAWDAIKVGLGGGAAAGDLASRVARDNVSGPAAPVAQMPAARADRESVLMAELARQSQQLALIESDALTTATERRKDSIPVIERQIELYEEMIKVRFGEGGVSPATKIGDEFVITPESLALYQQRNEMEAELYEIQQKRLAMDDTPLKAMARDMMDTSSLLQNSLSGGLVTSISSVSSGIWNAAKGTASFKDAWRGVGDIAGQALTEIAVKLLIIRPLLSMFGLGGSVAGAAVGTPTVAAAGGGTFLTRGPTQFTVGDNPGGVELVNVTPISGRGRTSVNGSNVAMAGGGSAMVAGAGLGESIVINQTVNFGGGVSRAEVMGMLPALVEASKKGVLEAQARRRDGFRR